MKRFLFITLVFVMLVSLCDFSENIAYGEEALPSISPQVLSSEVVSSSEPSEEPELDSDLGHGDTSTQTPSDEPYESPTPEISETPSPSPISTLQPAVESEPISSINPEPLNTPGIDESEHQSNNSDDSVENSGEESEDDVILTDEQAIAELDDELIIPPSENLNPDFITSDSSIFSKEGLDGFYTTESQQSEVADAVAPFLSQYNNDNYSDFEKIVVAHDYIVYTCGYDMVNYYAGTLPYSAFNEYGVFVLHTAVCSGYAYAFKYLMDAMGIECFYVTSYEMNHAWNIVKLGGKYYHVDATWNDPVWNFDYDNYDHPMPKEGYNRYEYLLISDDDISDHYGWSGQFPSCDSTDYNWLRDYNYTHLVGHELYTLNSYYSYIINTHARTYIQNEYINDNSYYRYLSYKDGYLYYYNYGTGNIYEHNISNNSREVLLNNVRLVDMYIDEDVIRYYNTTLCQVGSVQIPNHNTVMQNGFKFNKSTNTLIEYTGTSTDISISSSIDGKSVNTVGYSAFSNSNVSDVDIPSSVTNISSCAFDGCTSLETINISQNVTKIKRYTFYGCDNLQNIVLPEGITYIGDYAFCQNSSMKYAYIPSTVNSIASSSFKGCNNITIIGEDGSYAQTYAQQQNISFKIYSSEFDFNNDYVVDLLDLITMAKYYNQVKSQYDLVSDGKINIYDLVALAKHII